MDLCATTGEQVGAGGFLVLLGRSECEPALSFPPVTVQCTSDGQFVVVVARDATWPLMEVDSISLLETNDHSCTPVDFTAAFAVFQFPVTTCGTTMEEVGGAIKMAALALSAALMCKTLLVLV